MDKFDLCVIGGGPSGYAATIRALDFGKRVLLIEKNRVGGAGVFNGALSSKTLWEMSESYKITRTLNNGFAVYDSELNYKDVIGEMRKAMHEKYAQLKEQIDYFCRNGQLTFVEGTGKLLTKNTVVVETKDGKNYFLK